MSPKPKGSALKAWARSALVCIFASPVILLTGKLLGSGSSGGIGSVNAQVGLFLAIVGVAAVVHFVAFIAFGLPLFLRFYPEPCSRLWRWPFGVAIGVVIGVLSLPVLLALFYSRPIGHGLFETAVGGTFYGGITAIACLLNRPKVEQE